MRTLKIRYVIFSALFLCVATWAKLPFIIYGSFILAFVVDALIRKSRSVGELIKIVAIYAVCIIPAFAWYAWVIPGWDIGAVKGVTDLTWNHPVFVNVIFGTVTSSLPELLVNYGALLFFLTGFYLIFKHKLYRRHPFPIFAFWGITVIAYFLFEMNIIDLTHDYYLYPFLPPIFVLVAYSAWWLLGNVGFMQKLALLCLAILPLTAFLRADSRWDEKDPGFDPAYYKYKNELRTLTPKNALCVADNDGSPYILLYYMDRKGWALNEGILDEKRLSYYISKGAQYLYLDTHIDTAAGIKRHLDGKIFEKDALRVYKLK
jgi:hypothetical protein